MVYPDMHRRHYLLAASTAAIPFVAGCGGTESDNSDGSSDGGDGGTTAQNGSNNSENGSDGGANESESGPKPGEQAAGENVLKYNGLVIQEHDLVVEEEHGVEDVRVEGIVENTTDEAKDYVEVAIRIYDSDGHQLDSYFTNTTDLQAGGTWKFEVMVLEESDAIEEYDIAVSDSAL